MPTYRVDGNGMKFEVRRLIRKLESGVGGGLGV